MSYPGSKGQAGTWQRIIGQMPPHSFYCEPFAGSARIFFEKRRADWSVLIDKSAGAVARLRDAVRDAGKGDSRRQSPPFPGRVDVMQGDGIGWLLGAPLWEHRPDSLVYLDPPYLLSTRKGRRYYEHELSDDDHAALLSAALQLRCYVMISGYPSELYISRLANWRLIKYRTRTRGATVTECLWCNFPEPLELHDWRFAGQNKRQRHKWKLSARLFLAKVARYSDRRRGFVEHIIEGHLNGRRRIPTPLLASPAGSESCGARNGDCRGMSLHVCSECGAPASGYWIRKGLSGATWHTDNKTCGKSQCQRARKTRLQRERRQREATTSNPPAV